MNGYKKKKFRIRTSNRCGSWYSTIATFDVATRCTCCASCKRCNVLIKVDRAVYGGADLNDQDRIRSSRRFDSNPIYQDRVRSEFSTRIGLNLISNGYLSAQRKARSKPGTVTAGMMNLVFPERKLNPNPNESENVGFRICKKLSEPDDIRFRTLSHP